MAVVHFTKDALEHDILDGKKDALIDFWAEWCTPCKLQAPVLDELEAEVNDVIIGKVDVDAQPDLAMKFGVMSIPTMIYFRNGQVHRRVSGFQAKHELLEMIK